MALLQGEDRRQLLAQLVPALKPGELIALQRQAAKLTVSPALAAYVLALVEASRRDSRFAAGLSPRGGLALVAAARAWALLEGRDHVLPEDVKAVFPSVAGHRLAGAMAAKPPAACSPMFPFLDWRGRLRRWMLRRVAPQPHCRLEQNRIYLLPTRFGLTLCLVALAVWIGALNYDVSLAYALSFWVAGLLLVAVLMAYRQLAGLQLRALNAEPVFAGDVARFRVLLRHDDAGERLLNLALLDDAEAQVCRLPGGREFELELSACGAGAAIWPCRLATSGARRRLAWCARAPGSG